MLVAAVAVFAFRGTSTANALLLDGLLVVWALGLAWSGRGLWRARRWSRSPVLLSQVLLLLAVGLPLVQGTYARWAGALIVLVSLVGLVTVLMPQVTAVLD